MSQWKEKGIKSIKTVIFGRTLIVIGAFLIQFALLISCFLWMREYSLMVYTGFSILGMAVILHIFNSRGNPDFKLVWMLPILLFPVFGALFYLYISFQPGTGYIYRRLTMLGHQSKKYLKQNSQQKEKLKQENPQMDGMVSYMMEHGNCPVYGQTSVTYFPLGDDMFPEMLRQIEKAEKFIFMEYFILEEGYMWETILELLKKKVKEGVEVRVLYDGMCVLTLLPSFYPRILEKEGIRCKMFAPIKPLFSSHYNNRDHRKILVIDGKTGFTGGINLADEYINKKERFGHWKDTGLMIQGAAVQKFTCMFLEMWNVSERRDPDYETFLTAPDTDRQDDGYVIPYDVMPYGTERMGKQVYLDILNTACKYVHIMTPYLILDYEMITALTFAAKRGVEVAIIMPHIPDKKYAFALAKTYYNELLEAGVQIWEYEPGFVHAKVFVSDDKKAAVGTVNLDYRSLYHHFECGVFFYGNSEIKKVEEDFQKTKEKSIFITPADYKKLKLTTRLEGKVLRIVAPLM
ncbi:MAG: cardiolipin synthase [Blautia sp.]|nr:cardiolipin synthase [Blautia sp.]MDD7370860.1 cardiolipin synthase [Bacillota bacterium]MDY3715618.1 cardiolipin synthase [Blautia sp.]